MTISRLVLITPASRGAGFESLVGLRALELRRALERHGVDVLDLDVGTLKTIEADDLDERLRKHQPDAITAINFNYYLLAIARVVVRSAFERVGCPVLALADDPIGALANALPYWVDEELREQSTAGGGGGMRLERVVRVLRKAWGEGVWWGRAKRPNPLVRFQEVTAQPNVFHFFWDSGHLESMVRLGLTAQRQTSWYPIATYEAFLERGRKGRGEAARDVAFCGNLYLASVERHPLWRDAKVREIAQRVCEEKSRDLEKPAWDLLRAALEEMPARERERRGLWMEQRPFWDLYLFVVWHAANSLVRTRVLEGSGLHTEVFGMFEDPESVSMLERHPNLKYVGNAPHFDELPNVYATTRVNVCVGNALIQRGMPSKLIDCLASGGFALSDPKQDLVDFFGEWIRAIFVRNAQELREKTEYYLNRPQERLEIVERATERIRSECTLDHLVSKMRATVP